MDESFVTAVMEYAIIVRDGGRSRLDVLAKHDQDADQEDQCVERRMVDWTRHRCDLRPKTEVEAQREGRDVVCRSSG